MLKMTQNHCHVTSGAVFFVFLSLFLLSSHKKHSTVLLLSKHVHTITLQQICDTAHFCETKLALDISEQQNRRRSNSAQVKLSHVKIGSESKNELTLLFVFCVGQKVYVKFIVLH